MWAWTVDWGALFEGVARGGSICRRMRFSVSVTGWLRVGVWVMCGGVGWGCRIIRCLVRAVAAGGRRGAGCSRVELSLDTHPWLADHAVLDVVLLPGTGVFGVGVGGWSWGWL